MSLDPLSLGLAAAMPVLVFVLYLGLRSLRERRSLRRATVRPPNNGVPRQLAGRPDVGAAAAFTPTVLPLAATREVRGGVLAKVQAVRPMADVRTRPSGVMSPAATTAPTAALGPAIPTVVSASLSGRPYQVQSAEPSTERPMRPSSESPGVQPPGEREGAPSRIALTLNPLRTVLARRSGDRNGVEPQWPEHDLVDPAMRIAEYFSEVGDDCPACDENRGRGARFCRRCGRPLEPLSPSTAGSGSLARPAPSSTPALLTGPSASAAGSASWPDLPLAMAAFASQPAADPQQATERDDARSVSPAAAPPPARSHRSPRNGPARGPAATTPVAADAGSTDHRIQINAATAEELSTLRGIGPVTAERIIAARAERAFVTPDDLVERRVLGPAAFARIRDHVMVGP